jgi:hypothetical protein
MRTIAIIILMFIGSRLFGADCGWYSYVGTNQYSFEVSLPVIDKTPIWRESDDQPPLPARKSLRCARAELSKLFLDASRWRLDSVGLSPILEHEGHWVYLVRFYPPAPPGGGVEQGIIQYMTIPVLMSGVAVEPKISRWKR